MWTNRDDPYIRDVVSVKENMIADLFSKWKGKAQSGWVEQIRAGHNLRVLMRDDHEDNRFFDIVLLLTGVRCPDVTQSGQPEPYSQEACFFVEHYLLHREANIIFECNFLFQRKNELNLFLSFVSCFFFYFLFFQSF